jgi:hypothetical protein
MATKVEKTVKRAASDDEEEKKPSKPTGNTKKRSVDDSEAYHKTVAGKLKLKGVEITTK